MCILIAAKLLQKMLIHRAGNQSIFDPSTQERDLIIFQEFNLIFSEHVSNVLKYSVIASDKKLKKSLGKGA
jgi:hypothetical protein